jgi:hypothetical protein
MLIRVSLSINQCAILFGSVFWTAIGDGSRPVGGLQRGVDHPITR